MKLSLIGHAYSRILVMAAAAAALFPATARADGTESTFAPAPSPDKPSAETPLTHVVDRQWLYVDDAKVAAPGVVVGMTSVSYTNAPSNPDPTSAPYRAFAFNTAQPGALVSLGAEVGLLPRLSLLALGQVELGGQATSASPGAVAGLRLDVGPSSWRDVHLLVSAGYLRETWSAPGLTDDGDVTPGQPNGDNGAWVAAAVSADIHRLRLGLTGHGEHVFADGRDGVDVMLEAGASYRVVEWFRAGIEWVGQDLEETFQDGAEGGARHFVGPTAAFDLLHDRLTVVAGPSLGLSTGSPKILGRVALAYAF